LPQFDYVATVLTWLVEIAFVIVLAARADSGRRSASFAFFNYETSFSGWGNGWTFFIGCLPAAYVRSEKIERTSTVLVRFEPG
jgi:hypothetical protein